MYVVNKYGFTALKILASKEEIIKNTIITAMVDTIGR